MSNCIPNYGLVVTSSTSRTHPFQAAGLPLDIGILPHRTAEIAALAQRAAEAAFLVRLLSAHHLGRLAARLPPDMQQV